MLDAKTKEAINKYWDKRFELEKNLISAFLNSTKGTEEICKYMDLKDSQFDYAVKAYVCQVAADNDLDL